MARGALSRESGTNCELRMMNCGWRGASFSRKRGPAAWERFVAGRLLKTIPGRDSCPDAEHQRCSALPIQSEDAW